ncbi:unnamed protein product [Durusdinium trenchii]|uniref:Uncharacterized protein n=1 Tax=Durusdinium trenchii TaxID=1381693 RepID=A0ABP0NP07_9DINO
MGSGASAAITAGAMSGPKAAGRSKRRLMKVGFLEQTKAFQKGEDLDVEFFGTTGKNILRQSDLGLGGLVDWRQHSGARWMKSPMKLSRIGITRLPPCTWRMSRTPAITEARLMTPDQRKAMLAINAAKERRAQKGQRTDAKLRMDAVVPQACQQTTVHVDLRSLWMIEEEEDFDEPHGSGSTLTGASLPWVPDDEVR